MRTTILLSSLLFLAGYAPAQDSPITVGDTAPIIPGAGAKRRAPKKADASTKKVAVSTTKAAASTPTFVGHPTFQYDGSSKIHHVSDQNYRAACFTAVPNPSGLPPKVSLLDNKWNLVLNVDKKVELRSDKTGNRVEIDIHDKQGTIHGGATGKVSLEVANYPPTSAELTVDGTTYPYKAMGSDYKFFIHYCQIINNSVDCTDSAGVDACQ